MSLVEDKLLKNLLITTKVGVIIFLIVISFYVVKVNNDDYCGSDNNYNIERGSNTIYDSLLTTNNSEYLQSMDFKNKKFNYYEYYSFCFNSIIKTNDIIELSVINGDDEVLGTDYFTNSTNINCISINGDGFGVYDNVIGLRCVNCNVSNNITLANSISLLEPTKDHSNVFISESIDYNLLAVKNCKGFLKTLFSFLIIFVSLMSLIWLINIFIDWFEGFLFNGY